MIERSLPAAVWHSAHALSFACGGISRALASYGFVKSTSSWHAAHARRDGSVEKRAPYPVSPAQMLHTVAAFEAVIRALD